MSIDMYLPSLPAIDAHFHARPGGSQATLAAFFTGLALGQFFYGPASDRFGRRGPLLFGVALYIGASIWCALAATLPSLIVARFFQALGGCAGTVISRAVVRDRFDHRQSARILSQLMLVMGLAPILAPLAGGALVTMGGWQSIFWSLAAFGVLVGLWVWFDLTESRSIATAAQARGEHPVRAYLELLKRRRLVGYILAGALNSAALFAYVAASPSLLIGTYGIPAAHFGWVFGLNAVGLIGMSQVNAHLLHRHSPETILARSRLAAILFAAILAWDAFTGWGGMWGILAPLFFVMSSFGLVGANASAAALNVDPLRAGSIAALMGSASFAAGALAASFTAVLTTVWPNGGAKPMALTILAAILASSAALYFIALPEEQRARSPRRGPAQNPGEGPTEPDREQAKADRSADVQSGASKRPAVPQGESLETER
jgi:DHA1 family bicyclomycin/chloramphenicol resistance-like MFS transporter